MVKYNFPPELAPKRYKLSVILRDEHRIKEECDYAITFKYNEYHLLCVKVFKETIIEEAKKLGIEFKTANVY